ncbi:uncharacterized protein L201_000351 [Kwoniella dendrophila CBS 6074]|uniref:Uncharacterized protein n=1 Tax=Kwoniella dendrophila CBS 6074 TaxID=1295534 RepID=A0AAX4JJ68_9TREE
MLYNVHTPQKTFALTHKEEDNQSKIFERIWTKSALSESQKSQATLLYEFEGERWSLDDDDDLEILSSRFPSDSTTSVTLHLQLPQQQQQHAHFNGDSLPSYSNTSVNSPTSPSSKLKNRVKKSTPSSPSVKSKSNSQSNGNEKGKSASNPINVSSPEKQKKIENENHQGIAGVNSVDFASLSLGKPMNGGGENINTQSNNNATITGANARARSVSAVSKAKSTMSTKSRRSKWGDDDAEPLGVTKKREWEEFHNNNGVRTVMGNINGIPNIRMLLKSGYRHVYVSRDFALKHKIVPKGFGMGTFGYTGLKIIGNVDITVGTKTQSHQAYLSEENHFDVILGRSWLERMAIKIDPLDPTSLTYMDNGEAIPCDIVVLKDEKGNVITIT